MAMSSMVRSSQQPSSETTTKKKFGKNLNKLTKPPAPPTSAPAKSNASSRNGLLLLSTKRPSSGASNAASAGGILSSKSSPAASKPLPYLGLQYESELSTHEALLGAVVGASRAEAQQQPDAWGVAEKHQQKGGAVPEESADQYRSQEQPVTSNLGEGSSTVDLQQVSDRNGVEGNDNHLIQKSNWDEYGGRSLQVNESDNTDDNQVTYMSQMAKERAERRRAEEEERQREQKERAAQKLKELEKKSDKVRLEKLGRSQSMPEEGTAQHTNPPEERIIQRTLYDPNNTNRSYSALAGGAPSNENKEIKVETPRNGQVAPYTPEAASDSRDSYSRQPVIQLSSYEDRDRGERGSSNGPRMLFDPKSGSMVAVPSRDEAIAGRGRKERNKKGRNPREKDGKGDSRSEEATKGRKGKGRRDESNGVRGKDITTPAKADSRKQKPKVERRLPRTCGVLYAKDNKGGFYCSDGCDGDLGYGAHSVPGGRARNPDAYTKFVESQEHIHLEDRHGYNSGHRVDSSYEVDSDSAGLTLQTGLSIPEPKLTELDWVKPGEKIGLITGIDDSPTLQATAKEWAPSALFSAAPSKVNSAPSTPVHHMEEDDEHEDEDDTPLGLGFDPTLNMTSVIQSPSTEPSAGLDHVNLAALSLEPTLHGASKTNHNIFAFDSGSTWGATNSTINHQMGGSTWGSSSASKSSDWGVPLGNNGFSNDGSGGGAMPASFLSLTSNTWGGVSAFGSSALGSTPLNGDASRSTGD